ncbi:MAG TPA: hypothetical protein VE173_08225, partial [Longimicrobiales bacterium]|nr:hypothetical protein [Longimicrobiales bacterium]
MKPRRSRTYWTLALAAMLVAARGVAQERSVEEQDLPASVAREVVAFFNDSATVRFDGPARVPAGGVIVGDV